MAASLGVSKGGFYWHFKDRQALVDEMLDSWEKTVAVDVIARIESEPAEPRAKLQQLFELARTVDFAVELALRDWSRRDANVAKRVRRVDNRRMAYLRGLSTDPAATTRFDRFMIGLYCALLFMLFACAAFVVASARNAASTHAPRGVRTLAIEHIYTAPY